MLEVIPEHLELVTIQHADLQQLGHQLVSLINVLWFNDPL